MSSLAMSVFSSCLVCSVCVVGVGGGGQVVCSRADIDLVERDPWKGQRETEEQLISGISTSYLLVAGKQEMLTC